MNRIIWCEGRILKVLNVTDDKYDNTVITAQDIQTDEVKVINGSTDEWYDAYDYIHCLERTLKKIRELV